MVSQLFGAPVLEPYTGLLETVLGENMTALCAAGVGGGSLVYQGMTLQPAEAVVNSHFPEAVPLTWHPLGGACMGTVCVLEGRVHGQRGLYVLDGALMPGNTAACNPSMTIAAVAERALDRIVAADVGTLI